MSFCLRITLFGTSWPRSARAWVAAAKSSGDISCGFLARQISSHFFVNSINMKLRWNFNELCNYVNWRTGSWDIFQKGLAIASMDHHFKVDQQGISSYFFGPSTRVKARHVGCKAKASRSRRPSQLPIVFTEVGKGLQPKKPKRWPPWRLKRPFQKSPEKTRFIGSTGTKNNRTDGSLRFFF